MSAHSASRAARGRERVETSEQPLREATGPKLGLMHLLRMRTHPAEHAAWLRESYGEVYKLSVFGTDMWVASGPDAFEQVFVNRDRVFASGPAWSHFIGPFFQRGLMLLDAEEHLHHRRIMQQAFSPDALRGYHSALLPHTRRNLASWQVESRTRLHGMLKDLTLDLALEVFLGLDLTQAERAHINSAFVRAVRAGTSVIRHEVPGGIGPWSQGLAGRRTLEEFIYDALPSKRRDGGDDLFAQLCLAVDEDGNAFSDEDIVNHMIFLLMAAHDTTTVTMTSMAYQLARYPKWQERCRDQVLGQAPASGDPSYDDLAGFTDLDLVMKESLRLCAPVPSIPRVATRETQIDGYRIPAGALVTNSPYQNHYLEHIWPNPERFDPERFAEDRRDDRVHRHAFVAFGSGVHKCIGTHFAGMQIRAIFYELLRTYRWTVPEGYEMPIDLAALPVPHDGLPVSLERL